MSRKDILEGFEPDETRSEASGLAVVHNPLHRHHSSVSKRLPAALGTPGILCFCGPNTRFDAVLPAALPGVLGTNAATDGFGPFCDTLVCIDDADFGLETADSVAIGD